MCVDFVLGCIIAAATPSMEFIMGHGFYSVCTRVCVCVCGLSAISIARCESQVSDMSSG